MDLEVKGVAASPRRQAQLSSRGKKYQLAPCEQADCRYSGAGLRVGCGIYLITLYNYLKGGRSQGWRPDTRATRGPRPPEVPCLDLGRLGDSDQEEKTIPENLPSPADKYKLKYRQYEADMKEEYKQYSQRIEGKKKDYLKHPEASIKSASSVRIKLGEPVSTYK
ncbi:PREDICTED: calcyphosin-2-like [Apaloderma vittatum]|uniref:calcyphosin-2-like n=1 Tax=Apaloderma vittatum TaxID=57397 RepID=UPI0005216706|nr:PREDICTED: calcyphosin-2-like [Apaloderma vittatum]